MNPGPVGQCATGNISAK